MADRVRHIPDPESIEGAIDIGKNLRIWRRRNNISQRQLALLLFPILGHVPDITTISRHENRARGVSKDMAYAYAKALGITLYELFCIEDEPNDSEAGSPPIS